jgi:hypothetical protein
MGGNQKWRFYRVVSNREKMKKVKVKKKTKEKVNEQILENDFFRAIFFFFRARIPEAGRESRTRLLSRSKGGEGGRVYLANFPCSLKKIKKIK